MFRFCAALFAVLLLSAAAQNPPESAKPKPAASSEMKAYSSAASERDPEKKIELLCGFIKEYPQARMVRSARREIVVSAIKAWPKDLKKITETVTAQAKASPATDAASLYNTAAIQLNESGLYPKQALKWAQQAVKMSGSDKLAKASSLDTLGQIQLKAGDAKKAEQSFQKALQANPGQAASATALAKIAASQGQSEKALEFASKAFLARPVAANRTLFAEQWKSTHNGSMDGSDLYLDERYARLFPPSIHAKPYDGNAARTVLVEVHTGSGCPPCAGADVAMDAVMEHYSRHQVALVFFHQHIPRPDPMSNSETLARWKYVQGTGVPTYLIDGAKTVGGGARDNAEGIYKGIDSKLANRLAVPAGANLKLNASQSGESVKVNAQVSEIKNGSENLQVSVALVEKLIKYSGENGIRYHPMVVRSLKTASLKKTGTVTQTFDIDQVRAALKEHIDNFEKKDTRHNPDGTFRFAEYRYAVNSGNLAVVAFVEDSKTKEVLQTAYFDLAGGK